MNISAQMTKFLQSNLFDLGDLDLGQPLGECVCAEGLLEGRESERLVALSEAGQLRLALADGHGRSSLDALLAVQVTLGAEKAKRR